MIEILILIAVGLLISFFKNIINPGTLESRSDANTDRVNNPYNNGSQPKPGSFVVKREENLEFFRSCELPTVGNYWWVRSPNRAISEILKMAEGTNAIMRRQGSKLIFDEAIFNNFGTKFQISIETNSSYPHSMPKAYIRKAGINIKNIKHQYSGGRLCLMRSGSYRSSMSILHIRNQTASWCFAAEVFINTGAWPTAEAD